MTPDILHQFRLNQGSPVQAKPLAHITEVKRSDGNGHMVDPASGSFNAWDKKDLLQQLADLATLSQHGVVSTPDGRPVAASLREVKATASQAIRAAFDSPDPRDMATVGASLANALSETADRQGLMRRLLKRIEVQQGGIPRIPVDYKSVMGYVASSDSALEPQSVRQKYLYPPEFFVTASILIDEREIASSPTDILEQKLAEGQQACMAAEDRAMMRLINQASGMDNEILTVRGTLTPGNLGYAKTQIMNWDLPVQTLLMASDLLNDVTTSPAFAAWVDPVHQYEIVQTGTIGTILGMNVITDAYRVPTQKVLNRGDFYCLTDPRYLGGYTDRGPLKADAFNGATNGLMRPARGWYLREILSMGVVGGRGISRCRRVS